MERSSVGRSIQSVTEEPWWSHLEGFGRTAAQCTWGYRGDDLSSAVLRGQTFPPSGGSRTLPLPGHLPSPNIGVQVPQRCYPKLFNEFSTHTSLLKFHNELWAVETKHRLVTLHISEPCMQSLQLHAHPCLIASVADDHYHFWHGHPYQSSAHHSRCFFCARQPAIHKLLWKSSKGLQVSFKK